MKKIQNIIFPLVILILVLLMTNKNLNEIYIDLNEAKNKSCIEDKPLLIIFEDEKSREIKKTRNINEYIVCYLNYNNNKKIFEEFKIKKIPSYIVIDNRTNIVYKNEDEKNKKSLYEWLSQIKTKIRSIQKK